MLFVMLVVGLIGKQKSPIRILRDLTDIVIRRVWSHIPTFRVTFEIPCYL